MSFPRIDLKQKNHAGFVCIALLFLSQFLPNLALAQEGYEHFSVAAHGAGRTYGILSEGIDAIGLNPALLGYQGFHRLEISVLPISAFGIDAGPGFRDVNSLSTVFSRQGGLINANTRGDVADLLSNSKLSGRADVEVFAASYFVKDVGGFGLSWTTHAGVRTDFPNDLLTALGRNAEANLLSSDITASGLDLQGLWYNEYGLSFGRELFGTNEGDSTEKFLGSLSVGGAIKFVTGVGYMRLDPDNAISISVPNNGTLFKAHYTIHFAYPDSFDPTKVPNHFDLGFLSSSTAGTGFGFDLGAVAGFLRGTNGHDALRIGVSATDLGSITWNKNAQVRSADTTRLIDHTNGAALDHLNDSLAVFAGKLQNVGSFTSKLPGMFRMGVALDLEAIGISLAGTNMTVAGEYANGLTDVVGSLKTSRLGAGIMLNHPGSLFSLRAELGYTTEATASSVTFGLGTTILNRVSLDLATSNIGQIFGNSGSIDLAFSLRVLLM